MEKNKVPFKKAIVSLCITYDENDNGKQVRCWNGLIGRVGNPGGKILVWR